MCWRAVPSVSTSIIRLCAYPLSWKLVLLVQQVLQIAAAYSSRRFRYVQTRSLASLHCIHWKLLNCNSAWVTHFFWNY
jgi:hypothetical protein